jgi:hypothetical protein
MFWVVKRSADQQRSRQDAQGGDNMLQKSRSPLPPKSDLLQAGRSQLPRWMVRTCPYHSYGKLIVVEGWLEAFSPCSAVAKPLVKGALTIIYSQLTLSDTFGRRGRLRFSTGRRWNAAGSYRLP